MSAPARVDPPPELWSFCRADVVEHLFGDIDSLLITQRFYRLQPFRHALPAVM